MNINKTYSYFQTTALEACAQIRERLSEIKGLGQPNQYGLFLTDEDPKKGVWLEPGRTLEHYLLRDNVRIICIICRNLNKNFMYIHNKTKTA